MQEERSIHEQIIERTDADPIDKVGGNIESDKCFAGIPRVQSSLTFPAENDNRGDDLGDNIELF